MDTCSRLEEPGGVGWKDVNVGRLRTTTSGKRVISGRRVAARSDWWPRNLACAIPCCGVGWSNVGPGWSRRRRRGAHNAGDAAVGGPRGGDCPLATGERAAAHGARHFKKLSSAVARLCGVETALCYPLRLEGSDRSIIGGTIPVKKRGPWVHEESRVVTPLRRRSRLGR